MRRHRLLLRFCVGLLLTQDLCAMTQKADTSPQQTPSAPPGQTVDPTAPAIGDEERSALTFTAYDLAVHLRPDAAGISVLARVTVRNDGPAPLQQIAFQISSPLHWDSASETESGRTEKLAFQQHHLQTSADRTGEVSEAVLRLPAPLKPKASVELTLLYSGSIGTSSTGDPEASGNLSSSVPAGTWDRITPEGTWLRGFGSVLWYPVASPQIFSGEGASLAHSVGQQMSRQATATAKLRLSVEYSGEAPGTALFCGREQPLVPNSDNADAPVAVNPGVATADFAAQPLGFRTLSLFVAAKPAPVSTGDVSVFSEDSGAAGRVVSTAAPIVRVVAEWLGSAQARAVHVLDHPGEPFTEGSLLVVPIAGADDRALASLLVPALTHARFRSAHAWLDQGMAEFFLLLWLERTEGRPAALTALDEGSHALALTESSLPTDTSTGQGLLDATDAVYYRTKAAQVLWQLRSITGDDALKQALQRYGRERSLDDDPAGFERALEQTSGENLRWFFDDWVYRDRGLPDLSIVSAAPRQLSSKDGRGSGWLVAVEVRNDGGAVADVPVTVRSGELTATERLRIGAHSVASTRILFQGTPEQVQVNDGSVPEMIANMHTQEIASP